MSTTTMAMSLPLSPPPSRSSSQRSTTHAAVAIMPPSASFLPSKISNLQSLQQVFPQRPTIVLPSDNQSSFLVDPSASALTATTASSDLRSFFSPCSSDDESESEEHRALRGSPRTTRKTGHFSRLWASINAPSLAPSTPLPAVTSSDNMRRRTNNPLDTTSSHNSTSTSRKTIRRKSTFGPARRLSLANMVEALGPQQKDEEIFWDHVPYPPPAQPVFAPSSPPVTTPLMAPAPPPLSQNQSEVVDGKKELKAQLEYLSQVLALQTALYTAMSSPPPSVNPEMAVMHQDIAKSHLQQLQSLSTSYASTLTSLSSDTLTTTTTPQIAIPKVRRKSNFHPRETPVQVTTEVVEATRERDRILVQTQKAHLRRASNTKIAALHQQLEDAERKVRVAEGVEVNCEAQEEQTAEVEEFDGGLSASRSGSCWSDDEDEDEDEEEEQEEQEEEEDHLPQNEAKKDGYPPLPSLTADEEMFLAAVSQASSPRFPPPMVSEIIIPQQTSRRGTFGNEDGASERMRPEDFPLPPSPPWQVPEVMVVDGVEMRMI